MGRCPLPVCWAVVSYRQPDLLQRKELGFLWGFLVSSIIYLWVAFRNFIMACLSARQSDQWLWHFPLLVTMICNR